MELTEKTLGSKRIFEGKVISLRVDTVELPDGNTSTREVVEHNGGVAIVPILDHDRLLMVRQFRQPVGGTILEIPAGTLKVGEDPAECAHRELLEETGYSAGKMAKISNFYLAPGYSSEMLHTFLADDLAEGVGCSDHDEFLEPVVVGLGDAVEMIHAGEIVDAKSICGILLAAWLFKKCPG